MGLCRDEGCGAHGKIRTDNHIWAKSYAGVRWSPVVEEVAQGLKEGDGLGAGMRATAASGKELQWKEEYPQSPQGR